MHDETLRVRVPRDLKVRLRRRARRLGVTSSAFTRLALEAVMGADPPAGRDAERRAQGVEREVDAG